MSFKKITNKEDTKKESVKDNRGNVEMENSLMDYNGVLGLKDTRNNLSEIFSNVIENFKEIRVGNVKKGGKTASIISTELLKEILEKYEITSEINYDKETEQFELLINQIDVTGFGDTKEEAIDMALDNLEMLIEDYFDNLELYMRLDNMKNLYPYYLRISHCKNREEILKVLQCQ